MLTEFRVACAITAWLAPGAMVAAQALAPGRLPLNFSEPAPCVAPAAHYHGVNPWVLRAILKVESDFQPGAVHRNANGSLDLGMAQINSIHFSELAAWGIAPANLMDGCVSTYVAAWHLARQLRKHGNSWFGVASYHSASPCQNARYAALLWNALWSWGVVSGARMNVVPLKACIYREPGLQRGRPAPDARAAPALAFDEGP
ncbi:lytic transglycosylase domain-containing protein [Ramlibacter sp. AN1133]|uniref:lytic transglycosylase domain-containing protein n=1 Tax=Ramlibacter sp. AN1133 TaxID=3133429 RepID=UPI0030C2E392